METTVKEKKQIDYTKFLWVLGVLITLTMLYLSIYPTDSDVYYIIAQGRDIIQNGIPYQLNSFNYFPIDTVIQNYGWCVLLAFMYDLLGNIGLMLIQLCLYIPMSIVGMKILDLKGFKGKFISKYVLSMIIISLTYINLRPQNITMLCLLIQLYVMLLAKEKQIYKPLLVIPLVVLFHMQFHMSMWIMHLVITLPFIFPLEIYFDDEDWHIRRVHYTKQGVKYFCITLLLSIIALFINPYGKDGAFYLINSLGTVTDFGINELGSISFSSAWGLTILCIVICFVVFRKKLKGYEIWMILGLFVMATESIRNVNFLPIVFFFLTPYIMEHINFKSDIFILPYVLIIITTLISSFEFPSHLSNELYIDSFEILDEALEYIDDKDSKICAGFATGNYLEFKGYHTFFDARPELYFKQINHTRDIGTDWLKLVNPDKTFDDIIAFYDFDYIIATPYNASYYGFKSNGNYEIIYENLEDKIALFKKIEVSE